MRWSALICGLGLAAALFCSFAPVAVAVDAANGGCGDALTESPRLLERLARAMENRATERLWETFVTEVGEPGARDFFVSLGPRDTDLLQVHPLLWPTFQPLAFRMLHFSNVHIARQLPEETIVTVTREGVLDFPTYSAGGVQRLRLGQIRRRQDALLRRLVREELGRPWRAIAGYWPFRAELEFCLVHVAAGNETVESVSVEAWLGNGERWVRIGAGTNR